MTRREARIASLRCDGEASSAGERRRHRLGLCQPVHVRSANCGTRDLSALASPELVRSTKPIASCAKRLMKPGTAPAAATSLGPCATTAYSVVGRHAVRRART